MSKIKLTKGELKRQRDSLKQFQRYLPTLQLKKQQLQMKILEFRRILAEKQSGLEK
jgi:V/A-type H+-transporting ATPase subunit D